MPILTTKELQALNDQLDFERVLHCKYLAAVQESTDQELKTMFQNCASQHLRTTTPCWINCAEEENE